MQFRQQDCLTPAELGPARAAECVMVGDCTINEGDIIVPPLEAASVSMDNLRVKKIMIVDKEANYFKKGYWDIELKYIFEYRLIFREADGCIIGSLKANSIFNRKLTLFGSEGSDLVISTDLFTGKNDSNTLDAEPFIMTEAKGMALKAELKYSCVKTSNKCLQNVPDNNGQYVNIASATMNVPVEINVTIGLFSIVKLFRIVDLSVESRGFAIPKECENYCPLSPCNYFDNLSFPMDIFSPPEKQQFLSGISGNIPPTRKNCTFNNIETGCNCNGNCSGNCGCNENNTNVFDRPYQESCGCNK